MTANRWRLALAAAAVVAASGCRPPRTAPPVPLASYERTARERFLAQYPGAKPRNWDIARAAERIRAKRAMGRYVLSLDPEQRGNDCSDFVCCAIDEGLGHGARFARDSDLHLVGNDAFEDVPWNNETTLQPGDVISIAHSPWYPPRAGAGWHVGMVGTDGMVYDFVKLKSWSAPRYGRHPVAWFLRHSRKPGEVIVARLRAEYRYRQAEPPVGLGHL